MDLAKAFEILMQGVVVSSNSYKYKELVEFLIDENYFNKLKNVVEKIGYKLIYEDSCFYLSKQNMSLVEQQSYITKHKKLIVAISFLKQIDAKIFPGCELSFIDVAAKCVEMEKENSILVQKVNYLLAINSETVEKGLIEEVFKRLLEDNVIEQTSASTKDRYRVLNSINYYLAIAQMTEEIEDDENA